MTENRFSVCLGMDWVEGWWITRNLPGNFWGWWKCSLPWLWWWFHRCIQMSTHKLYAWTCTIYYTFKNYTSIKLLKHSYCTPTLFQGLFGLWGHKGKQKQTQYSMPSRSLEPNEERDIIWIITYSNSKSHLWSVLWGKEGYMVLCEHVWGCLTQSRNVFLRSDLWTKVIEVQSWKETSRWSCFNSYQTYKLNLFKPISTRI